MKIGFIFEDDGIRNVNLNNPNEGNPGIGGTQYQFLILGYYIAKFYNDIEVNFYLRHNKSIPKCINSIFIEDSLSAIKRAKKDEVDIIIFRATDDKNIYNEIEKQNIKAITWAHNYIYDKAARIISNCSLVKRNVFVSKEQYDMYIDDEIINKSEYIFNFYPFSKGKNKRKNDGKIVVYLGSLVETKGFHILAKVWKDVLNEVPDAKLKVIGSGKVYSREVKMGKYGIAESKYEEKFIKYLLDENGEINKSVEFLGLMGSEKKDIFSQSSVGVINPSAKSETFGISAIEMEGEGVPVVLKNSFGLMDVVKNKDTGILFNNEKQFKNSIVKLLKNNELNKIYGDNAYSYVRENFSAEIIVPLWVQMFEDITNNKTPIYIKPKKNITKNYKWFRIINRNIKRIGILKNMPSFIRYIGIVKEVI